MLGELERIQSSTIYSLPSCHSSLTQWRFLKCEMTVTIVRWSWLKIGWLTRENVHPCCNFSDQAVRLWVPNPMSPYISSIIFIFWPVLSGFVLRVFYFPVIPSATSLPYAYPFHCEITIGGQTTTNHPYQSPQRWCRDFMVGGWDVCIDGDSSNRDKYHLCSWR